MDVCEGGTLLTDLRGMVEMDLGRATRASYTDD